ncbi:zinc finger protein 136-like [Harpegnathos saltator]|uniref:zinc finger protein 136-like n=1 Tax=Harpegnathos saltator TaxID=610380 RepID=UPI00058F9255|nr:zinc finger protein 136-like [Harpegnathos saltator]
MEAVNDDEMVNNLAHTERLMGNECRICLKSCTEVCELFRNNGGISEKLMAIAAVQVEEGDGLPAAICVSCNRLLNVSYDFKCLIQDSDVRLRQILKLQIHPVPHEKHIKDSATVKYIITDVISNIKCIKDDHMEQEIYTPHDIVTFDNTMVPSDASGLNDDDSHISISQEFMQKPETVEQSEKNIPYGVLKENVHNSEMVEVAFEETQAKDMPSGTLVDHSGHLSALSTNDTCVKQEEMMLRGSETSQHLANNNKLEEEDLLKFESKNDVSLEDLDSKASMMLGTDIQDTKGGTNCSDDEEKPLICRTTRQRCLHCIKSFATKLALQRHMIVHKHKTKLRYVCHMCDKQFSNIAKLKSHVRNNHEAYKVDVEVPQENNQDKRTGKASVKVTRNCGGNVLVDSAREEKRNFKFTCKFCSKQFIYHKSYISHAKSHPEYNEETTTSDDILDQSVNKATEQRDKAPAFKENESEEEEEEEDDDDNDNELPIESLQCTQCGKLFATKRNLKRHISTHSGLKFNCSTCGKGFSRVDKLKDHEQSKHKEEIFGNTDDEDDDEEDNENKINENSEGRKKDRHNRPHKCVLCPKAFAQAQSLANHMERHKRVKDTQKRFLCEVCSKCFAQSGSLVAHMRTHTGIKPYVCSICSRAFTKSTYLQLHLRTHSGEKPYICQYCSRAFARANTLARHITMHTGEAKYHCQICNKSFRRLTSLNEHTYTHTGQRPYACKLCTKRYNNAGSLYAHTKKCKTQQLSGTTTTYSVAADNVPPAQNDGPMSQLLIYSQRKLVEEATVGQVVPTPQYMVANVHSQKTVSANVIQPFTVEDPNVYNTKQFKSPYYAIYPNM